MPSKRRSLLAASGGGAPTGQLWSVGTGTYGQTAQGNTTNISYPVQVGALDDWATLSVGTWPSSVGAIKTDGTLWMWGRNAKGGVGDGTTVDKSSPVQIGALTTWESIACGNQWAFGIKTDGTLWAWGYNQYSGFLGIGTLVNKSSPVQVGGLTTWGAGVLSAGQGHNASVDSSGRLWGWGSGFNGQLLNNQSSSGAARSSPSQIGALTTWAHCAAGASTTHAIKTDGTLWAGGNNGSGRLGTNNLTFYSSPVQIGALTTWSKIYSGNSFSAALKTDGTLWTWGVNGSGQLGDGTQTSRSSPVQVGALTDWFGGATLKAS